MNILKHELKAGRKAFIFWSIGLFFIMFAGMTKYTGFSGDTSVMEIFSTIPKIVLAVFGMVGIDISSLSGFYSMVVYYGIICASIYSVSLGCNAVNGELIDKTYDFIFTKPCSRSYVLSLKLLSTIIYITLYSILSYVFSIISISVLNIENTIKTPILLYTIVMWLIGVLFCTLSAFVVTVIKKTEKGVLYSNLIFVTVFVLGMAYDMIENGNLIRFASPLKYFLPVEVLNGELNVFYVSICLALSIIFYLSAAKLFEKKDLQA